LNTRKSWPAYFNRSGNYIKRLRHHYGFKVELLKWALPFLTKTSGYFFWIWYLQNRAYKNFLLQNEVKHIQIGYDELGMHKEEIMSKVRQFVGGADHSGNYSTERSRSHILVGNVKKSDPKRRKDIIYDNRWLYRTEWLSSAAIYRNIMNFNNKEVYRNIRQIPRW
jgi:hypothetical protein